MSLNRRERAPRSLQCSEGSQALHMASFPSPPRIQLGLGRKESTSKRGWKSRRAESENSIGLCARLFWECVAPSGRRGAPGWNAPQSRGHAAPSVLTLSAHLLRNVKTIQISECTDGVQWTKRVELWTIELVTSSFLFHFRPMFVHGHIRGAIFTTLHFNELLFVLLCVDTPENGPLKVVCVCTQKMMYRQILWNTCRTSAFEII